METDAACIAVGLFPLSSSIEGEEILAQWMRYLQCIRSQQFYPNNLLPSTEELNRRDSVLKTCFEGLVNTKLAVYIVPPNYVLGDICDIFEKLNTTGTKVSTVDLIHSWLYSDTAKTSEGPILLRDWMDDLGQQDGAVGWASSTDRPELVAQIVTACYIALDQKPTPRKVGRSHSGTISSIKSGDLLGVPTDHWKNVTANTELIAEFLRDFQEVVAGGAFPYSACPYPASVSVYVGLRWHSYFDHAGMVDRPWARVEVDALYRAFFWRNALINRYDQGFLTKLGTDLRELRNILDSRANFKTVSEWATAAASHLARYLHAPPYAPLPDSKVLLEGLTDGRPSGAAQKAYTLPMLAGVKFDLVDPSISLRFPSSETCRNASHLPESLVRELKERKAFRISRQRSCWERLGKFDCQHDAPQPSLKQCLEDQTSRTTNFRAEVFIRTDGRQASTAVYRPGLFQSSDCRDGGHSRILGEASKSYGEGPASKNRNISVITDVDSKASFVWPCPPPTPA